MSQVPVPGWLYARRRRSWLAAFLLVVTVAAVGFWRTETIVHRLDRVVADNRATACIEEWQDYHEDRRTAPLVGAALIEFAAGDVDPDDIARFEAIVARLVDEAIREPECVLDTARAELGD